MKHRRGMTLIELMIVVVMLGVLSAMALTGYKKVISKSRVTEGHNVVSGVKIAQDQYFAETGQYANIGWTRYCPQGTAARPTADHVWGWDPACNGGTTTWSRLAYSPDGPTRFGVMTQALNAGTTAHPVVPGVDGDKINGNTMSDPPKAPKPWYAVAAVADLDSNAATWTTLYTTSLSTQVWVDHEGE